MEDLREEELRGHLEHEKSQCVQRTLRQPCFHQFLVCSFKQMVGDLRQLKTEIEHLQHLLEKAKVKMQKDFEIWWAEQGALIQVTAPNLVLKLSSICHCNCQSSSHLQ